MTDPVNSDDGFVTFGPMIDRSPSRERAIHKYDENVHLAAIAEAGVSRMLRVALHELLSFSRLYRIDNPIGWKP